MQRLLVLATFVLTLVAAESAAEATSFRLGGGVNYWFVEQGEFDLTLQVDTPIIENLSVGGRFGFTLVTGQPNVGIPIDLLLRFNFSRFYVEGMGGPWILFDAGNAVRGHGAFGFGVYAGRLSVGVEVGYLDPRAIIGGKIAYRF